MRCCLLRRIPSQVAKPSGAPHLNYMVPERGGGAQPKRALVEFVGVRSKILDACADVRFHEIRPAFGCARNRRRGCRGGVAHGQHGAHLQKDEGK